jgi:hypothetical protein
MFLHLLSALSGCRMWYTPSPKVMRCGSSIRFFVMIEDVERVTKWSHCIRWIGDELFYAATPTDAAKEVLRLYQSDSAGKGVHPAPIEEARGTEAPATVPLANPVPRMLTAPRPLC